MTYLAERLSDLRQYLDHAARLRETVPRPDALAHDLSLRNDVLHTLQMICQLVIDICGELSAQAGLHFADDKGAIANLTKLEGFPKDIIEALIPLPGFRNAVVHEYVTLDYDRVMRALHETEPIERFARLVAERAAGDR